MSENSSVTPARLKSSIDAAIWHSDLALLPAWRAWPVRLARVVFAVARGLKDGQLSLRAMSLVYTTLLSLVPLLAISFSVLKGFGVHNQIEPLLLGVLEPLGEKGVEITGRVIGFVENVKAGVLGSLGFALLIYTVISLMQKIERAFNDVWYVTRHRTLARRFSDYISVLIIGPVLVFSSLGITASAMSTTVVESLTAFQPFGAIVGLIGSLLPFLLVVLAFTFINVFMPNTKVQVRSALVGATVSGVLWQLTGWAFAALVVNSAKYAAIYTGFATLVVFMIWLYLSWLILLVGASIAFYHQHPEYMTVRRGALSLSNRVKERLALTIVSLIGSNSYRGEDPWTAEGLTQNLNLPGEAAESILQALELNGILSRTADDPPAYIPKRPWETTPVRDVLDAVGKAGEGAQLGLDELPGLPAVDRLTGRLEDARDQALSGMSLKDLALDRKPDGD